MAGRSRVHQCGNYYSAAVLILTEWSRSQLVGPFQHPADVGAPKNLSLKLDGNGESIGLHSDLLAATDHACSAALNRAYSSEDYSQRSLNPSF
jgi:hypothetical protein